MKKLLTIIFLLIPFTAFGGDITTFQNFGSLKIAIPSPPSNPSDAKATYMIATGIIPDDGTITGNLYDANGNLVARKRVYAYSGANKDIPFLDLDAGKQGYLSGQTPEDKWAEPEIKLWLTDRQAKDEEGKVSVDDKYYFEDKATKAELLYKISTVLGG